MSGNKTITRLLLSYTFPEDASGTYTLGTDVFSWSGNTYVYHNYYSYTVEVSNTPGVPLSLSATAGWSVKLSWQPPVDDGNSLITHYEYRYGIGASVTPDNYTDWTSMGSAMATYQFRVRARNAVGPGESTEALSETPNA